ncbi:MAG: glycosyltransferase family 4 protein [Bacteroidales bacterium]
MGARCPVRPMKLLLCMSHTCPWSHSIAASLQAMGHEVHAFDFAYAKPGGFASSHTRGVASDLGEYRKAITSFHLHHSAAHGSLRYVLAAPAFRRLAGRLRPDVVVSLGGGGYAWMVQLSGVRPYAVYVVGSEVLLASALARRINRRVLTSAAVVFANGEYLAERAREQAPSAIIHPLLIGVDVEKLPTACFDRRPIQLVCNRGFAPVYNNEAIVRALGRLPATLPDFRMVFVSGGIRLAETIALADRILSPQLRAKVEFLGGVAYSQVLQTLAHSHIFLSMSRSDGTATSLLEGMACGLFPIVSDIPQNRPLVRPHERNGALVPLDDDNALASAIGRALGDPDGCRRAATRNRAIVEQLADARRNRRVLAEHLERVGAAPRKVH